jgi:hypothetical protein
MALGRGVCGPSYDRGDNVGSDFRGTGENLIPEMRLLREEAEQKKETLFWQAAERELGAIFQKAA